ncbi:alpha-L-arabinofuranosidase C-terminal domain-containing protein [Novosphingobium sp. PP1Y]|uniref:alpha-L-arabinofuranosidase C-terminal domain-containing protein n=1 Tax=Novosphingobium sp. PP1Y TaxID=702113 RepID=UPI00020EFBD0|nr:alpha-L-arabinofuranosidase C-terminal domain-containing protein [Novosphingobium sp. PP1Y]CCA90085.1 alpha-N-arabinofuranosidase [Novosphingobium sp. PP1Y]
MRIALNGACTGLVLALGASIALPATIRAQTPDTVSATIDARNRSEPVTRHAYGMFIEPIGGLVARSIWAEMLDDRKFYYPVVTAAKDVPPPPNPEGRPGVTYRKWRPIGNDGAVEMDTSDPFVGKQSPKVVVQGKEVRGLGQSGISIAAGKRYVGHFWLSGDPGVKVQVALVWGKGRADRMVVALQAPRRGWQKAEFAFSPNTDASDARLEITGTGSGTFRVDAISLMPDDNIDGWRADTTAIARSLNSGMWRLPGGNFLSDWDWHGALGPRDKRAPIFDHAWSAMQPNDLGMDEWMKLTQILGVDPYVTVNAGLGDAHSAAEEVEYLNGPATSEWGARRAANGHPKPYAVKYWNIGNEPYGWWQIGRTTLDYFMIKHNRFAEAMRAVDPSIVLIGSGAMPDQLKPRDTKENPSLESIRHKFGTEEDWTGGLFAKAWGNFDGVSEHWYDSAEKRPDAPADAELMEYARSPSNQVRMKAEIWDIYRQWFPRIDKDHIFLSIDEYAYFGGANLKSALAYAMVMQEMLRHTDFLKMSAFTTGASTMDITATDSVLNSTGLVFKLYGEHFGEGTVPLAVTGNSPQPEPRYPVGYDHPQVRAGSPTYPLDIIAALGPDGKSLRIGLVNATFQKQSADLSFKGLSIAGAGERWVLTGKSVDAANKVGATPQVTITSSQAMPYQGALSVPPISIVVYEFPLRN